MTRSQVRVLPGALPRSRALVQPGVRGIFEHRQPTFGPCQRPQVVQAVTGCRAHGMESRREADDRTVAQEHRALVAASVTVVQTLEPEPVALVEAVVVDLF